MKPITALLPFFFFLLFAFTKAELVFDSEGEPLRNGGSYYISPPIGGGVITAEALGGTSLCPIAVVQSFSSPALPSIIETPLRIPFIDTNFPLQISFADLPPTPCTSSSHWVVVESLPIGWSVLVGDAKDFPSNVKGWFFIKPYENSYYKLVFCSDEKPDDCGNVEVHVDNEEHRRVVVSDKIPLPFQFVKVQEERSASKISMVV